MHHTATTGDDRRALISAPGERRRISPHRANPGALLLLLLLAQGCGVGAGREAPRAEVAASRSIQEACTSEEPIASHFAFRSSFWLNLHNFLFQEAKRSREISDDARSARSDPDAVTPATRTLEPDERERWDRAVGYYADMIVAGPHPDSVVILVNDVLAGSDSVPAVSADLFDGRLREILSEVAPIYRDLWWTGHDAGNRRWIAEMRQYLDQYEGCLAPRLSAQLANSWPEKPIQVDATVYASWFGAYTTFSPPHITMSSTAVGSRGAGGLESLLHEAGHIMLTEVEASIRAAAERSGTVPDPDLGHMLLFYTAGDLVWRAIPDHPTNAVRYGVWTQNRRAQGIRAVIAREWRPWLDGERTMQQAVRSLVGSNVLVQ